MGWKYLVCQPWACHSPRRSLEAKNLAKSGHSKGNTQSAPRKPLQSWAGEDEGSLHCKEGFSFLKISFTTPSLAVVHRKMQMFYPRRGISVCAVAPCSTHRVTQRWHWHWQRVAATASSQLSSLGCSHGALTPGVRVLGWERP